MNTPCAEIEKRYREENETCGTAGLDHFFPDLFICTESNLTVDKLHALITRSELRIGSKPTLVLLDYVQLMTGKGDRYQKTSEVAEGLKVVAKETGTIIVVASQTARPKDDEDVEIGLYDGKDSGSLENSSGLVIGAWRDAKTATLMHLRVLKATKGGAGKDILCNFDAEKMIITECSRMQQPG